MSIAILILSITAILLSAANTVLWFTERKQSDRRYCAMLDYTDRKCESVIDAAEIAAKEAAEEQRKRTEDVLHEIRAAISINAEKIEKLEKGVCPDFEKAMAAANAVNDFNAGISAIMTFDPIATARARRLGTENKEAD